MSKKDMYQTRLEMKKTINNTFFICICSVLMIFSACDSKKENKTATSNTNDIIQQVDTVIAIGKVTAANGTVIIAANNAAIVKKIFVTEGDTINEGDLLIKLSDNTGNIDLEIAKAKLQSIHAQNTINLKDLEREQVQLSYLEEKFKTSKALFDKKAETKENYLNDESNFRQQQQKVASIKQLTQVNKSQALEQQLSIDKTNITNNDFEIRAAKQGVISNLNVKIGQNISPNDNLGEIIDTENIIIEAEVDELFADKISVNQEVTFININTKQIIGKGTVVYTSPTLMNKSILFETANEADDRRVLRIKIKPDSNKPLLINAKLECQIKIK